MKSQITTKTKLGNAEIRQRIEHFGFMPKNIGENILIAVYQGLLLDEIETLSKNLKLNEKSVKTLWVAIKQAATLEDVEAICSQLYKI